MKQLTCELCGSTDLIKQDGVFVCQSCGCKYSLEEARKMMSENAVAVAGAAKPDNSATIANYLDMARNAIDAGNNKEAEDYCNRIIELDITNWEAWYIKGRAVGWQSTLANIRISESINAFSKALENCPAEMHDELGGRCKTELENLESALLSLRVKNFKVHPNDNDLAGLRNDCQTIIIDCVNFLSKAKIMTDGLGNVKYARIINGGLCDAWQVVLKDFNGNDGHPSDYNLNRFINEGDVLIEALQLALILCGGASENKELNAMIIQIYENMITMQETLINAQSYSVSFDGGWKHYNPSRSLTAQAKELRRKQISEWRGKIQQIRLDAAKIVEAAAKKRRDEYWAAHPEEKQRLEAELQQLQQERDKLSEQVIELKKKKDSLPVLRELDEKRAEVRRLNDQKSGLGIFKGKEKKALQEQIDSLEKVISALRDRLKQEEDAINSEIAPFVAQQRRIDDRCSEINNEFNRDR